MTMPQTHGEARLRAGARLAALFAAAVGLLVLAGWLFDVRAFLQVLPGQLAMTPNTAASFVLVGLALWWQAGAETRSSRYASRAAAALAGLIGLMSLAEYVSGENFGIDELLFRDLHGLSGVFAGRMGVITALSFAALAASLLTSSLRRMRWTPDALALLPGLLATISLAGYAYGVPSAHWIGIYKGMAIHTALAFLVLSIGALLARGAGGFSRLILSDTAGGAIARRIVPAALAVPLLLGWLDSLGKRARLFSPEVGDVLSAVANAAVLLAVLWIAAERLRRTNEQTQRSQDALKASERRYQDLVGFAPIGIYRSTPDGRFVSVNAAFTRLLGYDSPEDMLPLDIRRDVYFDARERERVLAEIERRDEAAGLEVCLKRRDGSPVWVRLASRAARTESGATSYFEGFVHDITERKQAEESVQKLLRAVEQAENVIFMTDPEGTITYVNPAFEKIYGYFREEALGKTPRMLKSDTQDNTYYERFWQRLLAGESVREEFVNRRRDGQLVTVEASVSPVLDAQKRRVGFIAVQHDVTERKRSEGEIRKSEERFRKLFDSNTIGIVIADLDGRTLEANDAYLDMIGYGQEELQSGRLRWDQMTPAEYRERDHAAIEELRRTGAATPWEKELIRKDGSRVPILIGVAMLEASEASCIACIVDLSALRRIEEQFRQAQKMEAVGQLAGGVAHDFNNLLTAILGYAELLAEKLKGRPREAEDLDEIRKAGERAASLTRQLLAFSRQQVFERKVLDLNRLIAEIEKMLRRLIGEDVDLVTALDPALAYVWADAGQLEQVVMNLAVNARDAMPRGGKLTIETSDVELDEAYARLHTPVRPGRYVMIAVSDTGVGMDAATRSRIFEPFFTTKEQGKGTGLGLATVYGIVKQSGGYIWAYSEPGKGTTFKVYLPPADQSLLPEEDRVGETLSVRGTETVLLVEDEESVRTLSRAILESYGYRVLEAAGAEEAIETAQRYQQPIHLLLTDVIMPAMGGPDLASRIQTLRPGVRVLYMSGYTDETVFRHGYLEQGRLFLQKPFTPAALARKLRDALRA